jgi:ornithine carbamoyltransferase
MPVSRDFLEFHQLAAESVTTILTRAGVLATAWAERRMPQSLQGKRVGLIVDDGGWRNTAAFDLGVQAMGGICVKIPISFNTREVTEDLAGYLDNWFDLLVVRTKLLSTLQQLAASADAPVVNARTQSNHPCETLGDLAYVHSKRGSIDGLKVVGVAPDANILRSWMEASICLPIKVVQVYPAQWHVNEPRLLNPNFAVSTDPREIADADVIITDCWPTGADQAELARFQISAALLDRLRPDAIFLPCPPVPRGQEVTDDAMKQALCQSRAAKAFLLHAQNALLEWMAAEQP